MKYIDIFLASSINDMHIERMELGNYIRSLNDRFLPLEIYFRLHMCEDISDEIAKTRKQDVYNAVIESCDYFYIMVWHSIGGYSEEEFDVALNKFTQSGAPRIMTFFKEVEGDIPADVMRFMARLDENLQHYYTRFSSIDSVKLKILLELSDNPALKMKLEFKDSKLLINGAAMADINLDNLPFYGNHEAIGKLRAQTAELEHDFAEARKAFLLNPDDEALSMRAYEISMKKNETLKKLHEYEMQLLEVSARLTRLSACGEYVTQRTKAAIALFDAGKTDEAIAMLDEEEYARDLKLAKEKAEVLKNEFSALLKERLTKIDMIRSKGVTSESAQEIKRIYEDARALAREQRLDYDCIADYAEFLLIQKDFERGIDVAEKLYFELKGMDGADEMLKARICNLLASLYSEVKNKEKAEELYSEALCIIREQAKKEPGKYDIDLAAACSNLGLLYDDMDCKEKAEAMLKEAFSILEKSEDKSFEVYSMNAAPILNNLGRLHWELNRPNDAEKFLLDSVAIHREAVAKGIECYEALAMGINNLATLYETTSRPEEAAALYAEALEIYRKLAEENPEAYIASLAWNCNNLANIYSDIEREEEAETLYKEALSIRKQLAQKNPKAYNGDLACTFSDLANLYYYTNRFEKAEDLNLKAIAIRRELAKEKPEEYNFDLARSLHNLAVLYTNTGNTEKAEELHLEALEIREKLAEKNPEAYSSYVALTYSDLAVLYDHTGRKTKALKMCRAALEIYRKAASKNPGAFLPNVAKSCFDLACLYMDMNRMNEARKLFEEALRISKKYKNNPVCAQIIEELK